jgi:RNA polymerase sigma-70 factor (ECF subfamily)
MIIGMEGTHGGATTSLREAFDALYSREARTVLRYLGSVVREPAVAEDLCGEAFCKAWDSWPRFRGNDDEARAWVIRIARNLVIDRVRRDGRLKFEVLSEANPMASAADTADQTAMALDLRRAMSGLGRDDRDLLAMRVAGLSHFEIGSVQGKSEEAVKKAWQRALKQLRSELEADA